MNNISNMKKLILLFSLIIISNFSYSQTEIEAKGVFSKIGVEKQNQAIEKIQGKDKKEKKTTIENVKKNPNDYNPPVLYALSRELFEQGNKDDACFWSYLVQLRVRYDANLCMDNSAKQGVSILNNEYGPEISMHFKT